MFLKQTFVDLHRCLRTIFGDKNVATMLFYATSYPTGMWSFQMASKKPFNPMTDLNTEKAAQFSKEKKLHYYNEGIHIGAFAVPNFVKKMLEI